MQTPLLEPEIVVPAGRQRWWVGAFGVSTALHVAALGLLAGIWFSDEPGGTVSAIDTRWTVPKRDVPLLQIEVPTEAPSSVQSTVGGGQAVRLFAQQESGRSVAVTAPDARPSLSAEAFADAWSTGDLGQQAAYASGAAALQSGAGDGRGSGVGNGTGSGGAFFGATPTGQRFVYVVDCSGSMNKPHESEAGTRFRLLKFELVRSIGNMTPNQQFFIIFFNDHALPMQAGGLISAVPDNQRRYLEWVARFKAVGDTDPSEALLLALRLRPDVVYFLTDGSFRPKVRKELIKLRQNGTLIHTFALGNADAEDLLRTVAEANGGEYHFVP